MEMHYLQVHIYWDLQKGLKLVESIKGVDAIFITTDKKVYVTTGIKDNFNLTNKEFTYEERR